MLINGSPIAAYVSRRYPEGASRQATSFDDRPDGIARDRWDVALETVAGTVLVECGAIRERVSQELARKVFRRELERKGGYPLVDEPGEDVLRVRAQIVDLYINAPETNSPGITRVYVLNAGEMTLMAELYDSRTNAILARVVDRERGLERGDNEFQIANRVTNTAEADRILSNWALRLRKALDKARGG